MNIISVMLVKLLADFMHSVDGGIVILKSTPTSKKRRENQHFGKMKTPYSLQLDSKADRPDVIVVYFLTDCFL